MRTLVVLALVFVLACPVFGQVNGHVEEIDGKPVLWVWGTHEERGYAHGYLQGEEAKEVFDDYFVDYYCYGSIFVYNYLRNMFVGDYYVDDEYQTEAAAAIQGMTDSSVSLYNDVLGRDIDATDILMSNAIVDLSQRQGRDGFGCSSLSSWGTSTASDPTLAGHLVITRHLDWSKHQTLTDNPLLVVSFPSEPDEQPWISLTYAGFMGAISGVNESGISAFLDMGNVTTVTGGEPYHPILWSVRNGLEALDYDGDGECTPDDIVAAITDKSRSASIIVHVTRDEGTASRPVAIECNNENGVAERDASDNTLIPGHNLAVTNHFRVLYPPESCTRYANLADSLTANPNISPERSWSVMAGAAGQQSNIQAMQYIESLGLLYWAVDTYTAPAHAQEPIEFRIEDLFSCPMGIDDAVAGRLHLRQNFPNPFNPRTTIQFSLPSASDCALSIYSVDGRLVRTLVDGRLPAGAHQAAWDGRNNARLEVANGVYGYRLDAGRGSVTRKMLLVR